MCPSCLKHRLILSPAGWVFCPDWYSCEWEMSFDQYQKHDVESERKTVLLKSQIESKTLELQGLEAQLERLTISVG